MTFRTVGLTCICLLGLSGCKHVEDSEIVAKFKARGGGNPDRADVPQIGAWLSRHDDVRKQLNDPCFQKRKSAPADWANTDEGKICDAVVQATFFAPPPPVPKDRNTF